MQSASTPLLTDLIHTENITDGSLWHQLTSPTDPSFDLNMQSWASSSLVALADNLVAFDDPSQCIPGGLSQITINAHSPSPTPSPVPTTISLTATTKQQQQQPPRSTKPPHAPHPYSISPANTAALFTRASSVTSNCSSSAPKKSRAPPSGPISTKDFIPPDVTGLSKREARLVKNRAAAFLSRQRKREEFETLETRVDQLLSENARLQAQLDATQSGAPLTASQPTNPQGSTAAHLTQLSRQQAADLAQLKKSHANEIAQLNKDHSDDILQLKRAHASDVNTQLMEAFTREEKLQEQLRDLRRQQPVVVKQEEDVESEDSDADDDDSAGKESAKGANVAFMVLLFSLSTLLSNKAGAAQPASNTTRGTRSRPTSFSFPSYSNALGYGGPGFDYPPVGLEYGTFGALDVESPFNIETLLSSSSDDMVSSSSAFSTLNSLPSSSSSAPNPLTSSAQMASAAESAITSLKACGPDAFEFDFRAGPSKQIRVCVKGAGAGSALAGMKKPTSSFGSTFPSPIKFQPDDDLDMATTASASPAWSVGQKRKRMVVQVDEPITRPAAKRRLSSDDVDETWQVNVSEEDYLDLDDLTSSFTDEDVLMRF